MTPDINVNETVQTRSGLKARIIETNLKSNRPIAAVVTLNDGSELVRQYKRNGQHSTLDVATINDLINVPERITYWLNFYPHKETAVIHLTRESADELGGEHRLACVPVSFVVGEGL